MTAGTSGTKEIATRYPIEEGLTARTQSQTGRQMNLVAEEGSVVPARNKVGIE